ncbi:MAG: choline dehydrogenase [Rhodospirillaceae bacterium]|nr:choline dehydrogenase [Rhodospirillaceae bacterium]
MKQFDYIIVGAGTAGCVLANRLSAEAGASVLLLEAGGPYRHPMLPIPMMAGLSYFIKSTNWNYASAPEPYLDNRRIAWPRGKVLGGTSSINGMMYIRGHRRDYDGWAESGLDGWSYNEVLPYFKRAEGNRDRHDEFHGNDGPYITGRAKSDNPLYPVFLEACRQAGHPATDDFNGAEQEGVGRQDYNIDKGRRVCSATAYLAPVRSRPNLHTVTRAHATKLLFEGRRAVGVEYVQGGRGGKRKEARAVREVIVCGGAVNSPALLQHSGIGDAEMLRALNIPVTADLPGVGQNLHDHLGAYVQNHCLEPVTLYRLFRADRAAMALLRVWLFGDGPGASIALEAGGFLRTRPELDIADIQVSFVPGLSLDTTRSKQGRHGYLSHFYLMRPKSRGQVAITSADPFAAPLIAPNSMAEEADRRVMRDGVRLVRDIMAQPAFARYRGAEISPGADVQSDGGIDAWVRANATTVWHPVGTSKMGGGEDAVVDSQLRVHGIEALRIVDASVMPEIIGGNTAAPTIMIAEKAADMILGRAPAMAHL